MNWPAKMVGVSVMPVSTEKGPRVLLVARFGNRRVGFAAMPLEQSAGVRLALERAEETARTAPTPQEAEAANNAADLVGDARVPVLQTIKAALLGVLGLDDGGNHAR